MRSLRTTVAAAAVLALLGAGGAALALRDQARDQDQDRDRVAPDPVVGDALDPSRWPLPVSDAPCPDGSTALADHLPFVQVGDRSYSGALGPSARTTARLGRTVLVTRCRYADGAPEPGDPTRSGDASSLPRGTAVRELVGFDPRLRLAAEVDGRVEVFEGPPPTVGGTGADVLPGLAPRVRAVHLASPQDGRTVLARIDDPARVARLVRELLAAPYRTSARGGGDVFLLLRLDDGTALRRRYDSTGGGVLPGLRLPERARAELATALRTREGVPAVRCVAVPGDVSGLGIDPEAEELVGLSEADLRARAGSLGLDVRVVGRDDRCTAQGPRLRRGRVNVHVQGGVVRDAARY